VRTRREPAKLEGSRPVAGTSLAGKAYEQRMKFAAVEIDRRSQHSLGCPPALRPKRRRTNRGAGLRSGGHPNDNRQSKRKRDISNEVRKGDISKEV